MIVNSSSLNAIWTDFKILFQSAFMQAKPLRQEFAMEIPSSTKQNLYPWFENMPQVREWFGDRHIADLEAIGYTIVNRKFESSLGLYRTDIEDDNLGVYQPVVSNLGYSVALHPDRLLGKLLQGAFDNKCYDGVYFCGTHKFGPAKKVSYSNAGTAALSPTSYAAARAYLLSVLGTDGNPFNFGVGFTLVCGPTNETMALQVTQAELIHSVQDSTGAAVTNVWKGTAKPVILPDLSGDYADFWFLMANTPAIRPVFYQKRQAPRLIAATNPDSEEALMRDIYVFGSDYRGNAGYGLWQQIYGSDGSA